VPTLGQPEAFLRADAVLDQSGNAKPESREFLESWMRRYVDWIKRHAA
jgi:chromate reductase